MINHHPTPRVLEAFVAGDLPASISVVVASHIEMCEECKSRVFEMTSLAASALFNSELTFEELMTPYDIEDDLIEHESSAMLNDIMSDNDDMEMIESITSLPVEQKHADVKAQTAKQLELNGSNIELPRALNSIELSEWKGFGKISRSRLGLEDENLKTSLLHIDKGGSIPNHTHKGFEITMLLQGSFSDEFGEYQVGDFIWLDGKHTHTPFTENGCICLTVSSDAISFTQGVSKLLNPIGRFIY